MKHKCPQCKSEIYLDKLTRKAICTNESCGWSCYGDLPTNIIISEHTLKDNKDVKNPEYYTRLKPQLKDVQMNWNLPAFLFNAMKYIVRAGHKENAIDDCKKAIRYLEFEIERLEKGND